jgi:hypothetical protein
MNLAEKEDPGDADGAAPSRSAGRHRGISRRRFLGHGSLLAGAAAAMAAIPGVGSLLASGEDDAPALGGAASAATEAGTGAASEASEPLIAHVIDASTGEINLYQGTQQITTRDPALARALARLATSK